MKEINLLEDDNEQFKTPTENTLVDKFQNIMQNGAGAIHFLKAFCEFAIENDDWKDQLNPLVPKLEEFLKNRDASINNPVDIIQYGHLFIVTVDSFFRSEFIKENISLTEAEKTEMAEEVDEAFQDKAVRKLIQQHASVLGWKLYDLMDSYVDKQWVDDKLNAKLNALRLNFTGIYLATQIGEQLTTFQKGHLIAKKLQETVGVVVMNDNSLVAINKKGQEQIDKLSQPDTSVLEDHFKVEEVQQEVNRPMVQFLKQIDKKFTL